MAVDVMQVAHKELWPIKAYRFLSLAGETCLLLEAAGFVYIEGSGAEN